jgi:hypothetical protein
MQNRNLPKAHWQALPIPSREAMQGELTEGNK